MLFYLHILNIVCYYPTYKKKEVNYSMTKHTVWFAFSPELHEKLQEYIQKNKPTKTMTKFVLFLLYHYNPEKLYRDFKFTTENRKMMMIKVSDTELEHIRQLADKYEYSIHALARNMVYTFLKKKKAKLQMSKI